VAGCTTIDVGANKTTWWLVGAGVVIVGTGALLVALRVLAFVPFRIPSAAMYPTLEPGSHIWMTRLDKKPVYGAMLVFRYPENPEQDFAKRVVGLPGDVIETSGPTLTINGWEVPHCEVGKHGYDDLDSLPSTHSGTLEVEWLGDETFLVFHDAAQIATSFGPYTVKSGEYFVMGDNRENSHDSRRWFGGLGGGVPDDNTRGRVREGKLALPRGAASLRGALDACLAKKPAKTRP
jgi:signal peptidase I